MKRDEIMMETQENLQKLVRVNNYQSFLLLPSLNLEMNVHVKCPNECHYNIIWYPKKEGVKMDSLRPKQLSFNLFKHTLVLLAILI